MINSIINCYWLLHLLVGITLQTSAEKWIYYSIETCCSDIYEFPYLKCWVNLISAAGLDAASIFRQFQQLHSVTCCHQMTSCHNHLKLWQHSDKDRSVLFVLHYRPSCNMHLNVHQLTSTLFAHSLFGHFNWEIALDLKRHQTLHL